MEKAFNAGNKRETKTQRMATAPYCNCINKTICGEDSSWLAGWIPAVTLYFGSHESLSQVTWQWSHDSMSAWHPGQHDNKSTDGEHMKLSKNKVRSQVSNHWPRDVGSWPTDLQQQPAHESQNPPDGCAPGPETSMKCWSRQQDGSVLWLHEIMNSRR